MTMTERRTNLCALVVLLTTASYLTTSGCTSRIVCHSGTDECFSEDEEPILDFELPDLNPPEFPPFPNLPRPDGGTEEPDAMPPSSCMTPSHVGASGTYPYIEEVCWPTMATNIAIGFTNRRGNGDGPGGDEDDPSEDFHRALDIREYPQHKYTDAYRPVFSACGGTMVRRHSFCHQPGAPLHPNHPDSPGDGSAGVAQACDDNDQDNFSSKGGSVVVACFTSKSAPAPGNNATGEQRTTNMVGMTYLHLDWVDKGIQPGDPVEAGQFLGVIAHPLVYQKDKNGDLVLDENGEKVIEISGPSISTAHVHGPECRSAHCGDEEVSDYTECDPNDPDFWQDYNENWDSGMGCNSQGQDCEAWDGHINPYYLLPYHNRNENRVWSSDFPIPGLPDCTPQLPGHVAICYEVTEGESDWDEFTVTLVSGNQSTVRFSTREGMNPFDRDEFIDIGTNGGMTFFDANETEEQVLVNGELVWRRYYINRIEFLIDPSDPPVSATVSDIWVANGEGPDAGRVTVAFSANLAVDSFYAWRITKKGDTKLYELVERGASDETFERATSKPAVWSFSRRLQAKSSDTCSGDEVSDI